MENSYFITGEPNELVATPLAGGSKIADWNYGYGKKYVAALLLIAAYNVHDTGNLKITSDHWLSPLLIYATDVWLVLMAYNIYKGSFKKNKNLLIINSKGIVYNEKTFFWRDIQSFKISLERAINKRNYLYYLHLTTKDNMNNKIDISNYNKKMEEIHNALRKNMGNREVKDLGFSQII